MPRVLTPCWSNSKRARTPAPLTNQAISTLQVQFSQAMLDNGPTGAHSVTNPASYTLAGPDGAFGTGDDSSIGITGVSYDSLTNQATLSIASGSTPLTDGSYELVVNGTDTVNSLQDLAGNTLANGHDEAFVVTVDRTSPQATLLVAQPSQTTNQAIYVLVAQFSESMSNSGPAADHSVTNPGSYRLFTAGANGVFENGSGDDVAVPIDSVSYDGSMHQAVLFVGTSFTPLADGKYELVVNGSDSALSLDDLAGNALNNGADTTAVFQVDRTAPQVTLASPAAER